MKPSEAAEHEFKPKRFWTTKDNPVAYDKRSDDEIDHDAYVSALICAFNPPDGDDAQSSILLTALDQAWEFIVAHPCSCPPPDEYGDIYPRCARCDVLGRAADVVIER